MNFKRFVTASLLILAPVIAVHLVKQTQWGPVLATPPERQLGGPGAKVIIVEFSDFQCPTCARVEPTIHQLLDVYKGKVRFIYKYFPLKMHRNAMPAARAADCAADQKQFWPYHDRLFDTQLAWATLTDPTTSFMAMAEETKLDIPKFTACYADVTRTIGIEQDVKEGTAREVSATPTFFVGDERLVGQVIATDGARTIEKAMRQ